MTKAETELCYQWAQRNRAHAAYQDDREYKRLVLRFWNVLIRDLIKEVRAERNETPNTDRVALGATRNAAE